LTNQSGGARAISAPNISVPIFWEGCLVVFGGTMHKKGDTRWMVIFQGKSIYPLVMTNIAMENTTIFRGKIYY
jgi:hypothetical protein